MADKINFTKATIDALPLPSPSQKRREYIDTKQPGLRLRVTSTGIKSFCVLKRVKNAGMERITLDRYPGMSIEQARNKAADIIGKIAVGDNPAEVRRSLKADPTFAEFFIEYGERHGKSKKAWADDCQRFRDYLAKPLGNKKLTSINSDQISRVLSDMERGAKANATINNVRALASGMFGRAIEWNYLKDSPVKGIKTRKATKRDRFLQIHELPRFFTALADEPNETIRDYLLISLFTGARRANVLEMEWANVNLEEKMWRIPRTKNGDPQNVTLSPEAVAILETRKSMNDKARQEGKESSAFVFPGTGKSGHLVEPKKGWTRIFDRDELNQLITRIRDAGGEFEQQKRTENSTELPESLDEQLERARIIAKQMKINIDGLRMIDLRIHDLRRTLGSWQAKTGSSLLIIGKSLNQKSPATTAIYARLDTDPVRASVERATNAMVNAGVIKMALVPLTDDALIP